ncbi:MBOAT family protein [Sporosarcina sp. ANT_H38]|uniref:MBOAT family O-acyltransferase n=1 Tax=Sporosarcina sp. ANT_H38 TaxID=2597358 RepID=UPI0011F19C65|nr:MBOAT family O-acyltransferase [Sporosarcina sp. ANT_H38]KAA0948787.1 MBOAT family protein [Sporosarcina sp. ANT_H38]
MVFSSLLFLFFFLPTTLLLYFCGSRKMKNGILLTVSLIFYAWGEPVYIFLMIFSAITDYCHGLFIQKYRLTAPLKAKLGLLSSIIINLSLLSFFKYADFLIENINNLFGMNVNALDLPLPIGLSFYTFQTMSYAIDVYRGRVKAQRNPLTLALYVCLFPQLIAGPIVRYEIIEHELKNRRVTLDQFSEGVKIFLIGLGKKVLLANNIGFLWSEIQQQSPAELSVLSAWMGIAAFGLQLYFDFSGYSDMAIGLGKMFGFNFPQNFNYPFASRSITDFWRRWHMTLGGWFRDYVYIPLGGSRKGKYRLYLNLFIVWGLTGLWHGAAWNFVAWGLYFGVLIAIEKAGLLVLLNKMHPIFQHIYAFIIIMISWVLFVFEDLSMSFTYLKIMFGFSGQALVNERFMYDAYTNVILFLLAFIGSVPIWKVLRNKMTRWHNLIDEILIPVFCLLILVLSTAYLADDSYNPFLYFRF